MNRVGQKSIQILLHLFYPNLYYDTYSLYSIVSVFGHIYLESTCICIHAHTFDKYPFNITDILDGSIEHIFFCFDIEFTLTTCAIFRQTVCQYIKNITMHNLQTNSVYSNELSIEYIKVWQYLLGQNSHRHSQNLFSGEEAPKPERILPNT